MCISPPEYISVQSFISIKQKTALNCLRLFVVVYKRVICVDELLSWYISVPRVIVRGPTISKLYTVYKFLLPEAVCCVYKLVMFTICY